MAQQAGMASWIINNDNETESEEVREQARQFLKDNNDVIQMLRDRFDKLKDAGDGDSLLMLSQLLCNLGVELAQWFSVYGTVRPDTDKQN